MDLEKTNAVNINQKIIQFLTSLYNGNLKFDNLRLLISDGAPYAIKVGKLLKSIFAEMKHVTCLCHMLHRICEYVRNENIKLDYCISELKKTFIKNKSNKAEFNSKFTKGLPKFPILTRWGSWINCACYIFNNYAEILKALDSDLESFMHLTNLLKDSDIKKQLEYVKNFEFLSNTILSLEKDKVKTEDQIKILNNTIIKLKSFAAVFEKTKSLINKNVDLDYFLNYNSLTCSKEEKIFEYIPLTSVSAERSFSLLKILLTEKRTNLSMEKLEMLLILYYNNHD